MLSEFPYYSKLNHAQMKLSPQSAMRDLTAGYWVSRLTMLRRNSSWPTFSETARGPPSNSRTPRVFQPQLLYRALRTLASYGVFAEIKGRPQLGR
jgi:hypothetical protein